MIGTAYSKEHALWAQVVRNEAVAKQRFEFMTGETTATKFFNGTNRSNVDEKLMTLDRTRGVGKWAAGADRAGSTNSRSSVSIAKKSNGASGRYHSTSKMDALSTALQSVISEKRSNAGSSRRGISQTVSRSAVGNHNPLMLSKTNAGTFRDIDS